MSLLKTADFFYSLRFLRLLTTPWTKTGAYKEGIIDENGKVIKKPSTDKERSVYNTFHKLVFNLKRLLNKVPFGKSTIASYAAALFLIKEKTNISEKSLTKILKEATGVDMSKVDLCEDSTCQWFLTDEGCIRESRYTLTNDISLIVNGEALAHKQSTVTVKEHAPVGYIFGIPVFEAFHHKTNNKIYITQGDITR